MSKIIIEFESKGNAAEFFNAIIADYYYSVKNSEDKELEELYDSLKFIIKSTTAPDYKYGYDK